MTALLGGEHPVRCAENTKRSKKSQALRMTVLREFSRKTSENSVNAHGTAS
jgi:hypothetical protein